MKYMYIRVSTVDQNTARQETDIETESINQCFIDKCSGKNFDRPEYQKMKSQMKDGDTLILHSIDRLGRNYDMIIQEWQDFSKMGIGIKVLDMPLLDTTDKNKTLDTKFLSDLVLQILSYVAERERINIKERARQGIEEAKKRGVYERSAEKRAKTIAERYPNKAFNWELFETEYAKYKRKEINNTEFAQNISVSIPTLNKRKKEYEQSNNG